MKNNHKNNKKSNVCGKSKSTTNNRGRKTVNEAYRPIGRESSDGLIPPKPRK